MYLAGVIRHDGVVVNGSAGGDGGDDGTARSPRVVSDGRTFAYVLRAARDGRPALRITQNDVRAIQLAKAALYAGVRLLMERMGVEQVDRIRLAGAFGSHIDVKYAMVLGMIPDCALDKVSSAGNAAGTGARMALLDRRARPTSSNWCAASRRSRPRSNRASRNSSSKRWPFRTSTHPACTCGKPSNCRRAPRRAATRRVHAGPRGVRLPWCRRR